jgi:hypothetical protein
MHAAFARELRVYEELQALICEWSPAVYGHFAREDWDIFILEDLGPRSLPRGGRASPDPSCSPLRGFTRPTGESRCRFG